MESQNVLEAEVEDSSSVLGDSITEVVWTVLSTSTAFVLLVFIVTCIKVLIMGNNLIIF